MNASPAFSPDSKEAAATYTNDAVFENEPRLETAFVAGYSATDFEQACASLYFFMSDALSKITNTDELDVFSEIKTKLRGLLLMTGEHNQEVALALRHILRDMPGLGISDVFSRYKAVLSEYMSFFDNMQKEGQTNK